ncbi:hypothetical protein MTP99_007873 [Tenebrio molitor]|nr:hypothetical protein MTP99_007873 [Tenebrio molitor]
MGGYGDGYNLGWKQCGSLNLARTRDRMTVFRRMKAQSVSWKIDFGGLWIPGDGAEDPYETCLSVVGEAKKKRVKVYENCTVIKIHQKD